MCTVTIDCQTVQGGGASSMGTQNGGALTMYPNPNRGDLVTIALSEVPGTVYLNVYRFPTGLVYHDSYGE